jgi:hypothetical protein
MPFLPLDTLIYGSADAGETIHADTPHFNTIIKRAAGELHLVGHTVCGKRRLHTAGDVEGME